MDSGYNCVNSYPHQRGKIHYCPHHHPGAESIPTAMCTGSDLAPMNDQYIPWSGNYGYIYPPMCHGCFPSHYPWMPPSSCTLPVHCPGSFPSPMHYVPLNAYAMHPPWEHATRTPINHHCCGGNDGGCSSRNAKIVEEEPDGERKNIASCLLPSQLKNCHPIGLLPPDASNDKDDKGSVGDVEPHGNVNTVEKQPTFFNSWFPYGLRSGGSSSQGERHEDKNQKQQANEPSMVQSKSSSAEETRNGKSSSRIKEIPVKDVHSCEDKESATDASARVGNGDGEQSDTKCKMTGKHSTPQKSSKLPPVCLRVDPLPKRRIPKGKSRSQSPCSDKRKLDMLPSDKKHDETSSENEKPVQIPGIGESKNADMGQKPDEESLPCQKSDNDEVSQNGESVSTGPVVPEEVISDREVKDESKRSNNRELSDEDAAITIQSAYRGFEVRKSEPLNKLKVIAKVRRQIAEMEDLIQKMESSLDIQCCTKQGTVVAETIMSLLLELDTIQGLHPSIREARKYVVRQLVDLQEKLDFLINKKTVVSPENESVTRHGEEAASQENTRNESEKLKLGADSTTNNFDLAPEQIIRVVDEQMNEVQKDIDSSTSSKMQIHRDPVGVGSSELSFLRSSQSSEYSSVDGEDKLGSDSSTEFRQGIIGENYTPESANGRWFIEVNKEQKESAQELDLQDEELNVKVEDLNVSVQELDKGSDPTSFKTPQDIAVGDNSSLTEAPGEKVRNNELLSRPYVESGDEDALEEASCEVIPPSPEQELCNIHDSANICGLLSDQGEEQAPEGWKPEKVTCCQEQEEMGDVSHHSVETGNENDYDLLLHTEGQGAEPGLVMNKEKPADDMVNSLDTAVEVDEGRFISHVYAVEKDNKLVQENIRLREMIEELIRSSEQQLTAISNLSGRVRDLELERRQSRKWTRMMKQRRAPRSRHPLAHVSGRLRTDCT